MKPHEETWTIDLGCLDAGDGPFLEAGARAESGAVHGARCKLAAQAPAMARLLLSLSEGVNRGDYAFCPVCDGNVEDYPHRDDCRLIAVLKAAGVVE